MTRIALFLIALGPLAACETVEGAGQDIQSAGQGIENTAEAVERDIQR